MPDKIKPSEVSELLLNELQNVNAEVQFEEVGKVLQVTRTSARRFSSSTIRMFTGHPSLFDTSPAE